MARDFTKDAANYMDWGVGALGAKISGAGAISFHCIAKADTFSTANNGNNRLIHITIDGVNIGLLLSVDATGAPKVLRGGARAGAGEAEQNASGTSDLSTGTEYSFGIVADIAGDRVRIYVNGTQETSGVVAFTNTTWTLGTPTDGDRIGGNGSTPPLVNTQWDGSIAEPALWAGDIGSDGFYQLNKRVSALLVRPDLLVFYPPIWGKASPEKDLVSGLSGTITGTIAQRDPHPRIYMPRKYRAGQRAPKGTPGLYVHRQTMRVPGFHPIYAG